VRGSQGCQGGQDGQGRQVAKITIREEDVQRTIVDGFTAMGYIVLQTSRRVHLTRCPKCQTAFRPRGFVSRGGEDVPVGDGASKGVPDLIVCHPHWPAGVWLGIEVKGSKTPVSPEQAALQGAGRIFVVRSWEDALRALRLTEERF
jgi:hypothetical protein